MEAASTPETTLLTLSTGEQVIVEGPLDEIHRLLFPGSSVVPSQWGPLVEVQVLHRGHRSPMRVDPGHVITLRPGSSASIIRQ